MKIITHPQSRAYDEGWDAIFGKHTERESEPDSEASKGNNPAPEPAPAPERDDHVHELGSCSHCDTAGRRMPRGWTPKQG
jgi:hypothetical protein